MQYPVYAVSCHKNYIGQSLVAAESALQANQEIDDLIFYDRDNGMDSKGYCHVSEHDRVRDVYANRKGIVYYGIRKS